MRYIKKSEGEPEGLLLQRKSGETSRKWNDLPTHTKNEIRSRLLEDQSFLCCYCMRRIDKNQMHPEHYVPRGGEHGDSNLELAWKNLLAACNYTRGMKPSQQTCDIKKGATPLSIDPQNQGHMLKLAYSSNGEITYQSDQGPINFDINTTLNLNNGTLVRNRKIALEAFQNSLAKRFASKSAKLSKMKKVLDRCFQEQKLLEYYGIIEFYLQKKDPSSQRLSSLMK